MGLGHLLPALSSGLIATLLILGLFWKADDLISEGGRGVIAQAIGPVAEGDSDADEHILGLMRQLLPQPPRTWVYARNVALLSLVSIIIIGAIYFSRVGGLAEQFSSGAETRNNFVAQLAIDGFVKVFLVNYIALLPREVYARGLIASGGVQAFGVVVLDVAAKLALFTLISVASYVAFARYFGAFGGDTGAAIDAVLPTLVSAINFSNLTSVYLYAVAISSFPLFLVLLLRLMSISPWLGRILRGALFWLPFDKKPVRLAATGLAVFFGFFAMVATALLQPFAQSI